MNVRGVVKRGNKVTSKDTNCVFVLVLTLQLVLR